MFAKLRDERQSIDSELKKSKECYENIKLQQEVLTSRLQIVESLKDILEQQIGSNSVHDIMQRFSEYSQYTLNVRSLYKYNIFFPIENCTLYFISFTCENYIHE